MHADFQPRLPNFKRVIVIVHPIPDVSLVKEPNSLDRGSRDVDAQKADHPRLIAQTDALRELIGVSDYLRCRADETVLGMLAARLCHDGEPAWSLENCIVIQENNTFAPLLYKCITNTEIAVARIYEWRYPFDCVNVQRLYDLLGNAIINKQDATMLVPLNSLYAWDKVVGCLARHDHCEHYFTACKTAWISTT
jgi:hypothetical protein